MQTSTAMATEMPASVRPFRKGRRRSCLMMRASISAFVNTKLACVPRQFGERKNDELIAYAIGNGLGTKPRRLWQRRKIVTESQRGGGRLPAECREEI